MCYTWKLAGESSLLGSQKLSVFHNKTTTTTTTTIEGLNGFNRQSSNGLKFNCQPSKKQLLLAVKSVSRSFKFHAFSCSSRTFGFQRIILTGKPVSMLPNLTHFKVFPSERITSVKM